MLSILSGRTIYDALRSFKPAAPIEIDPHDGEAWVEKGKVLSKHCKYDEALQAYDKAIESNGDPRAWSYKGDTLYLLGRTTESDAALAKGREHGF